MNTYSEAYHKCSYCGGQLMWLVFIMFVYNVAWIWIKQLLILIKIG